MTTEINIIFQAIIQFFGANKFPNPFVLDPESIDFSKFITFNGVGEILIVYDVVQQKLVT